MDWRARIFFSVAAVAGVLLLTVGIWIFLVSSVTSPTVMLCGVITLALTGRAWRGYRFARARTDGD